MSSERDRREKSLCSKLVTLKLAQLAQVMMIMNCMWSALELINALTMSENTFSVVVAFINKLVPDASKKSFHSENHGEWLSLREDCAVIYQFQGNF
jgi:hypothetical protein